MSTRFYTDNLEHWNKLAGGVMLSERAARFDVYEHACLLPPVESQEAGLLGQVNDAVYRGGVLTQSGRCIPARLRADDEKKLKNLSCAGAYEFDRESAPHRSERVLFGGVLYHHLGHVLVDTFARLWYLVDHDDFDRIVFFDCPYEFTSSFDPFSLLDLLGISRDRIEIIAEPTEFREVIVPEEAFRPFGTVYREHVLPFDQIKRGITPGRAKKVYLSRRAYQQETRDDPEATSFIINEKWFEEFYTRRGFEIVHPEQLSIAEQVAVMSGAESIVSTIGTMTHMLLFANPGVEVVTLIRANLINAQLRVDIVRGVDPFYVDVASNPLPVNHARGPFLLMPNRHFKRYLEDRGLPYESEELDVSSELPDLMYSFAREWARIYSMPENATLIGRKTMFDVVRMMNEALDDDPGDVEDYRGADRMRTDKAKLRADNKELRREVRALKKSLKAAEDRTLRRRVGKLVRRMRRRLP